MPDTSHAPNITPEYVLKRPITIIGLGTIGRRVAERLGQWGVTALTLVDFDIVEAHNTLGERAQGYTQAQIGKLKTQALAESLREFNPSLLITTRSERIAAAETFSGFLFVCVDTMEARSLIRDSAYASPEVALLVEARIADTTGRIFALSPQNPEHAARYADPKFWYTDEQAHSGGCNSPHVHPSTAVYAAHMMFDAFHSYLRREQGSDEPFVNVYPFTSVPFLVTSCSDDDVWC